MYSLCQFQLDASHRRRRLGCPFVQFFVAQNVHEQTRFVPTEATLLVYLAQLLFKFGDLCVKPFFVQRNFILVCAGRAHDSPRCANRTACRRDQWVVTGGIMSINRLSACTVTRRPVSRAIFRATFMAASLSMYSRKMMLPFPEKDVGFDTLMVIKGAF